ncbi:MAG: tRNA lysidine(34) synthetase TilS [Burkholderiales bacterium]
MAGSRKSRPVSRKAPDLVSRVAASLRGVVKPGERLVVGLSGGVDSMVLLDILSRIAQRRRFHLAALHVNHRISPHAARWAAFCRAVCRARGVPLRVVRVAVKRGDSLEAAARAARYDALLSCKADGVVLAHNQDDQAETLLLQLLRGAGVKGLAAMPVAGGGQAAGARPATPRLLRPLLDVPRTAIEAYARARGLEWVEDESNADTYFLRNFLRHEVLPLLARRFPAYRATLARSARHFAEASQLLDELAAGDGAEYICDGALRVAGLRRLSPARARNLLRHFLARRGVIMPNAERLEEALRQSLTAKRDAAVRVDLGSHELRRFAQALYVVEKAPVPAAAFAVAWRGERRLALPEFGGVMTLTKCRGSGISLARLQAKPVTVRVRRGGERLQPACRRPRRSLKKLLQESRLPPWQRERLPLLFCGSKLVWAPGIGIDCEFQAQAGETSVAPEWDTQ